MRKLTALTGLSRIVCFMFKQFYLLTLCPTLLAAHQHIVTCPGRSPFTRSGPTNTPLVITVGEGKDIDPFSPAVTQPMQ